VSVVDRGVLMMADQHPWSHGVLAESKCQGGTSRARVQEKLNGFRSLIITTIQV